MTTTREIYNETINNHDDGFVPYDDVYDSDMLVDFLKAQAILHPEDQDNAKVLETIEILRGIVDNYKATTQPDAEYFQTLENFVDNELSNSTALPETVSMFADVITRLKHLAGDK